MAVSCSYITFYNFQKSQFVLFQRTIHRAKSFGNQKHCLDQEKNSKKQTKTKQNKAKQNKQTNKTKQKNPFFFTFSAILRDFVISFL